MRAADSQRANGIAHPVRRRLAQGLRCRKAGQIPVPQIDASGIIAADDFFYSEPTKVLGPGGGFNSQAYRGGRGLWGDRWVSIGNGIITYICIIPGFDDLLASSLL